MIWIGLGVLAMGALDLVFLALAITAKRADTEADAVMRERRSER